MSDKYPGFFTAIFGGRKAKEPEPVKPKTKKKNKPVKRKIKKLEGPTRLELARQKEYKKIKQEDSLEAEQGGDENE